MSSVGPKSGSWDRALEVLSRGRLSRLFQSCRANHEAKGQPGSAVAPTNLIKGLRLSLVSHSFTRLEMHWHSGLAYLLTLPEVRSSIYSLNQNVNTSDIKQK